MCLCGARHTEAMSSEPTGTYTGDSSRSKQKQFADSSSCTSNQRMLTLLNIDNKSDTINKEAITVEDKNR